MANPLPNEQELFDQIKGERITISTQVWNLLYQRIGDDLTAINLLCEYYLSKQEAIPPEEAAKILIYTKHIKNINNQLTLASNEDFLFPAIEKDIPLHPILRHMLTHYLGNDVYMINLILYDTIDPLNPQPVPLDRIQKIIKHTRCIKEILERLRMATGG